MRTYNDVLKMLKQPYSTSAEVRSAREFILDRFSALQSQCESESIEGNIALIEDHLRYCKKIGEKAALSGEQGLACLCEYELEHWNSVRESVTGENDYEPSYWMSRVA